MRKRLSYRQLKIEYFGSQTLTYLASGVFILSYFDVAGLFKCTGYVFIGISILMLVAPLCSLIYKITEKLDIWFKGGAMIASIGILIIDDILGPIINRQNEQVSCIGIVWLLAFIITNACLIGKRIGFFRLIVFSGLGISILMKITGNESVIYTIILVISVGFAGPLIDIIMDEYVSLSEKHDK